MFRKSTLVNLFVVLYLLLFVAALPAFAEEATPEPVVTDVPAEAPAPINDVMLDPDAPEPPVSDTVEPAFQALLTLATSVTFAVEFIKKGGLGTLLDESTLSAEVRSATMQGLAFVLALILVFSTEADLNILAVLGIYPAAPPIIAKVITAAAVAGGSMVLWAVYRFFKGGTVTLPTGSQPSR